MVEEYHVRKLIFLMHEPCEPVVRYAVGRRYAMPHMPPTGVSGVDLYTYDRNGREIYLAGKYQFKDTVTYTYAPIYISAWIEHHSRCISQPPGHDICSKIRP